MPRMHDLTHPRRNATNAVHVTEGSPVHEIGAYYHAGRGGAGNCRRLSTDTFATTSALAKTTSASSTGSSNEHFFGGRGGAGNAHPTSERAIFSFDEELEREQLFAQYQAPVFSVGRGGAGNIMPAPKVVKEDCYEYEGVPRRSTSSTSSERSRFSEKSLRSGADSLWRSITKVRSNE